MTRLLSLVVAIVACASVSMAEEFEPFPKTKADMKTSAGIMTGFAPAFKVFTDIWTAKKVADANSVEKAGDCLSDQAKAMKTSNPKRWGQLCSVEGYKGNAVCGKNVTATESYPNPAVWFDDECTTGPTFVGGGLDVSGKCAVWNFDNLTASFNKIKDLTAPYTKANEELVDESLKLAFGNDMFKAYVMNNPAQKGTAGFVDAQVSVSVVRNNDWDQCVSGTMESYVESKIDFTKGVAFVYNPTFTKDAKVTMAGSASVAIIGGESAASISTTTSGEIRIGEVKNSGPITITGVTNVFISNVVNQKGGDIDVINSKASVYQTTNEAEIIVQGSSEFYAYGINNKGTITVEAGSGIVELCANTGSVVIKAGANVTVKAPKGTSVTGGTFEAYVSDGSACGSSIPIGSSAVAYTPSIMLTLSLFAAWAAL